MRFRLVRSKAFWFGVPGLVFLAWAWVDSFSNWGAVYLKAPGYPAVGSWEGNLYGMTVAGGGLSWGSPEARYGPKGNRAYVADMLRADPRYRYFAVPYAVVVLLYVLVWAGLLVWRARKFRQAARAEGEA